MKYLIPLISIVLGYFISNHDFINKPKISTEKALECESSLDMVKATTELSTDYGTTFCIPMIANKGIFHSSTEAQSKAKIYDFFNEKLKDYYEPNEFNVRTNNSDTGTSAQKYDPRDDIYIRFQRVDKFDKKSDYGVISGLKNPKELMQEMKCEPEFNEISKVDELLFTKLLRNAQIIIPNSLGNEFEGKGYQNFTFFKTFNILTFFNAPDLLKRYRIFRNNCNKAVSVLYNFCIVDPRYDLQYEDMFLFKNNNVVGSNIYCKNSKDTKWTLMSNRIFKIK